MKRNPQGIRYFTCWSEHMKPSDKIFLKETMRKLPLLPGIEPHPQGWEPTTLTTAPIPLTHLKCLIYSCSSGTWVMSPVLCKDEPSKDTWRSLRAASISSWSSLSGLGALSTWSNADVCDWHSICSCNRHNVKCYLLPCFCTSRTFLTDHLRKWLIRCNMI